MLLAGQIESGNLPARASRSRLPEQLRNLVQSLNSELPVFGAKRLPDVVSGSLEQHSYRKAIHPPSAFVLAAIGVYGTISYIVSGRTRDIGIRIALGARRTTILQMILNQGLALALTGAVVGLVGALVVSHIMAGLLSRRLTRDPHLYQHSWSLVTVALAACHYSAGRWGLTIVCTRPERATRNIPNITTAFDSAWDWAGGGDPWDRYCLFLLAVGSKAIDKQRAGVTGSLRARRSATLETTPHAALFPEALTIFRSFSISDTLIALDDALAETYAGSGRCKSNRLSARSVWSKECQELNLPPNYAKIC